MEQTIKKTKQIRIPERAKGILIDIIGYTFLFIFIYTAYEKTIDYDNFVKSLERYPYINEYTHWVAWLTILGEVFVSFLLLIPKTRKLGLYASLALMIIFTISLLFMMYTVGLNRCSCGGFLSTLSGEQHLWFNGIFISLAMIGIYLTKSNKDYVAAKHLSPIK